MKFKVPLFFMFILLIISCDEKANLIGEYQNSKSKIVNSDWVESSVNSIEFQDNNSGIERITKTYKKNACEVILDIKMRFNYEVIDSELRMIYDEPEFRLSSTNQETCLDHKAKVQKSIPIYQALYVDITYDLDFNENGKKLILNNTVFDKTRQ